MQRPVQTRDVGVDACRHRRGRVTARSTDTHNAATSRIAVRTRSVVGQYAAGGIHRQQPAFRHPVRVRNRAGGIVGDIDRQRL